MQGHSVCTVSPRSRCYNGHLRTSNTLRSPLRRGRPGCCGACADLSPGEVLREGRNLLAGRTLWAGRNLVASGNGGGRTAAEGGAEGHFAVGSARATSSIGWQGELQGQWRAIVVRRVLEASRIQHLIRSVKYAAAEHIQPVSNALVGLCCARRSKAHHRTAQSTPAHSTGKLHQRVSKQG